MDYLQLARGLFGDLPDEQLPSMTQLQQPEQPQQQASGTDIVNRAVENAIRPAPNPYENQLRQGVLGAKADYNNFQDVFENPTRKDPQKALAQQALAQQAMANSNELANRYRNAAQAAGFDTSRYGAGATLGDVQNYLDSEKARDITEALQGAYSMNSDQFYERKYEEAIMRGLSNRQAKKLASGQAREYQANRVAYLDGVYNSYGHDGRVTNGIGYQILGMIANENPMLANLYGQAYPGQRDAYAHDNQLEAKILDQNNQLNILDYAAMIDSENRAETQANTIERMRLQQVIDSELEIFRSNRAYQDAIRNRDFATDTEAQAYMLQSQRAKETASLFGYPVGSKEFATLYAGFMGYQVPQPSKQDNKFIENGVKVYAELQKRRNSLAESLEAVGLTEDQRNQIQANIDRIDEYLNAIDNTWGKAFNAEGAQELHPYSADNPQLTRDVMTFLIQRAGSGAKKEDIVQDVLRWAHETDKNVRIEDLEKIYDELVGNGNTTTPPTTTNGGMPNQERARRGWETQQNARSDQFWVPYGGK